MDPSLTTVTGRVATIPSDINRLYDTAAAEIHRQNRRVRLDERGSHALYVSQPALSSSVKELENELGIEIFTRSSQGIALTVDARNS